VDIGGVDGLLHVSQLAWHRVQHPSQILSEGQRIQVRIEKVDPDTKKISLAYRDLLENPWSQAAAKYPPQSVVRGKVTKLMEYGAFVELEPGVEGLVHISELSHKRVWRTSDVVKEGDEVEVLVLAVDPQAQRISLSIKALSPLPQPKKDQPQEEPPQEAGQPGQPEEAAAQTTAPQPKPRKPKPEKPLLGGLDRPAKGQRFGLRW
jgi:small subunit ribosomal protein S1